MKTLISLWVLLSAVVTFASDPLIHLKSGTIDPLISMTDEAFPNGASLYLVQFNQETRGEFLEALAEEGALVSRYVPNRTYLVRMNSSTALRVQALDFVRWVGVYRQDYKQPNEIRNSLGKQVYNAMLVSRQDLALVQEKVERLGARVVHLNRGSSLIELELTSEQRSDVLNWSEISWLELRTEPEEDVDKAKIQGGATFITKKGPVPAYTGVGIKGHVFEGIYANHKDFEKNEFREKPISVVDGASSWHGQATYGIIFGSGKGKKIARGFLPNAQGYYTHYSSLMSKEPEKSKEEGRYFLVKKLIDENQVMFQTASWGYSRTKEYDARSAEMDEIIFDLDIPITQSQSNSGTQMSRPQAWAKNIISVGAVRHYDTVDPSDDKWANGASIGPAQDGRIKPDLCAYYDSILTTSSSGYTSSFGGTSGATPIVAGHVGLMIELWTDGVFGNMLKAPKEDRFSNRPHFTTTKALLINTAKQYAFNGKDHDLTRVHQGWGFPNLKRAYESRERMLAVNETDVLTPAEERVYDIDVPEDAGSFNVTLVYADPAAAVTASIHRVNDFDVQVTAPDGTVYWGNHGLLTANYSKAGGEPDDLNTVENIFVKKPESGKWSVKVIAREINQDGHVETTALDGDYALVVSWPKS